MQHAISGKINVTFLVTLCLIGASIRWTNAAECGTCMANNNFYCLNTTHFHPCYDGKTPAKDQVFECPAKSECTDNENLCISKLVIDAPGSTIVSVCAGNTATCNRCATGTKKFACVSKTQYSLCIAGAPLQGAQSCGPNEICSLTSLEAGGPICVPECAANFLQYQPSCSNDVTTPKPPTPTSAPNYDDLDLHCAAQCAPAEFCYTYNKNTADCKSYIGCEKRTNENKWDFFILQCPAGQFWNPVGGGCSTATCVAPP